MAPLEKVRAGLSPNMGDIMKTSLKTLATATMACLLMVGCGGGKSPEQVLADSNDSNMKRMANLYLLVQMVPGRDFAGPKDEEEFKSVVRAASPDVLTQMGVDPNSLDQVFVSDRDNEPFAIRYGVKGSPYGCQEAVIFEKTGVDGKRMVGFLNQTQKEVDNSEYDQLLKGQASGGSGRDSASGG